MADGFEHLSIRASDLAERRGGDIAFRSGNTEGLAPASNEVVARHYLELAMTDDGGNTFRGVVAEDSPALLPGLRLTEELRSPFGDGSIVRFRQVHRRIPVYGSVATVELGPDQELTGIDAELADGERLDAASAPVPQLGPAAALEALASDLDGAGLLRADGVGPSSEDPPELVWFHDREREFVLCWLVQDVRVREEVAADPGDADEPVTYASDYGGWESRAARGGVFNYFVDANTGVVVNRLPTHHSVAVQCTGTDEDGAEKQFVGDQGTAGVALLDPGRVVATHDLQFANYTFPEPALTPPISNASAAWGGSHPAGVSAHVNASVVYDFYDTVLRRQGIDGKRMALTSVVNCSDEEAGTEWGNAFWSGTRMVYGQTTVGGRLVSLARHLDVVAHEITHGVTNHTADLNYEFESGALNESMSDIFGVIIANQSVADPRQWKWTIGDGLGNPTGPLRDMQKPQAGNPPQPDHWDNRAQLTKDQDEGGVHVNSGIHNRAAQLVLVAVDSSGSLLFDPLDVARFYYTVLLRLASTSGFSDVRTKLVEEVTTRRAADPRVNAMVAAVHAAYATVGIV